MSTFKDITGKRFGRLVVLKMVGRYVSTSGKSKSTLWECICDCGKVITRPKTSLRVGGIKSCGCLKDELTKEMGKKSYRRLPLGHGARNKLFHKYRLGAKHRGLEFELSKERFNEITQQNCFYCGQKPSQRLRIGKENGEYIHNGIDRYNNDLGYVEGNVVPCCKNCNYAKHGMSIEEFDAWITRVFRHRNPNVLTARVSYPLELVYEEKFVEISWEQPWGDGTAEWYQKLSEELGMSK